MKAVLKFPLPSPVWVVTMPRDAQIVHVDEQQGQPVLWALCEQQPGLWDAREFLTFGTGMGFDDAGLKHVGTTAGPSGLVWHVFERGSQR